MSAFSVLVVQVDGSCEPRVSVHHYRYSDWCDSGCVFALWVAVAVAVVVVVVVVVACSREGQQVTAHARVVYVVCMSDVIAVCWCCWWCLYTVIIAQYAAVRRDGSCHSISVSVSYLAPHPQTPV